MNLFVAKWNEIGEIHPLICHMIDSGVVAHALWQQGLTDESRKKMAEWLNLSEEEAGKLISFWTSLHDIGKATPSFQKKCSPALNSLRASGYDFPQITTSEIRHHSLLSVWILQDMQAEVNLSPQKAFVNLLVSIGGHHGVFPSQGDIRKTTHKAENLGNQTTWHEARLEIMNTLRDIFTPPDPVEISLSGADANAFFGVLSGFFVTSDWLASQSYFTYEPNIGSITGYVDKSVSRAEIALKKIGWMGWKPDQSSKSFESLFPFSPNSLQRIAIDLAETAKEPFLMILEAPTGSGKTEAALYIADLLMQKAQLRGCYIAMPTQATSNQMFGRVKEFLLQRFPGQLVNIHLVHGNALINEELKEIRIAEVSDDENLRSGVNALGWFVPRKRTLLAPFGVGTVDQTFYGVLQTRHFFLRLFGLYRKVVIFDEVHAYDVYMVEIFKRLLAWLRAIGSSVIILSATLPQKTRQELLMAYDPDAKVESLTADFPRASFTESKTIHTHTLGEVKSRTINLRHLSQNPAEIVALLKDKLASGGCAAVICNTVRRAQEVYQAVIASEVFDPTEIILFHSRFPFCWRERIEKSVLQKFGKHVVNPLNPRRGVVIATQVIEQSLDLDFDLLITDLAPVDLLIQRIGRLHRHSQAKFPPIRPEGLQEPVCYLCVPELDKDQFAIFSKDAFIYEEYILQRSCFSLLDLDSLSLPAETDKLIEEVYSIKEIKSLNDYQNRRLSELFRQTKKKWDEQFLKAMNRLIPDVNLGNLMIGENITLEEDDPHTHRDLQALTRDTQPKVQLVCLIQNEDGSLSLLDGNTPIDLGQPPRGELIEHALRSMVSVSNQNIVNHFFSQPRFKAWGEIPQLRYAYPMIFMNGNCDLNEKVRVSLSPLYGLSFE